MRATAKAVSDECSAIAYYGIEPSVKAAESFYHRLINWFNKLGCPPDKVSVTGPGHSGKLVSFVQANAKLLKTGFEGVTVLEVVSTTPDAKRWGRDYMLTASYDGRPKSLDADIVVRSSLATLSPTSILPIARTVAEDLKPAYGIGFRMEHRLGPEFYVEGIGYGTEILSGEAYDEACNIARWGDMGIVKQVYRDGLLRDVYPWNFLTQPHLIKPVGGFSLQEWIQRDPRRGSLNALCDRVSLWEVAESDIPDIRRALRQADVIFDWQKYS
jgi:hypothetical protein